ncbi:MAG: radical SAM protein [Anaeromyxobacter sp.]|nr:radical SAM protein [Anaeromyxobacter sp.]MBL0278519.1 radical SAM protein [Anaeromyxobacter sp.]
MHLSRSAFLAPIPGSPEAVLVQPLTGQACLIDLARGEALARLAAGGAMPGGLDEGALREARFLVESEEEDRALREGAWADWHAEHALTPTQLIVVPTFGCNLRCTYCYQEVFDPSGKGLIAPEVVEAIFRYVDQHHAAERPRPYLTLFGGEPLVDAPAYHERLAQLLAGAETRGLGVATVTNGYDLEAFVPALAAARVKEVQVTLDGPAAVHDARRPHGSGRGTFERIVRGVDALVAAGVPVNLRVVADRDNLPRLPELAQLAEARGWLELPERRFKTQVGRNYELFGCAARQQQGALFDRVELWAEYLRLAEANPVLRRFHRPRFHGVRHLAEQGELPVPSFDACPAAKKEWAFTPDGGLYGCTATVGNPRYRLGSFHPEIRHDQAAIAPWRARNTGTIAACQGCDVAAVCGGGCGALADSQGHGIGGPDCRPVKALYGLGARFYGLG